MPNASDAAQTVFDELHKALGKPLSLIDELTINILQDRINLVEPKLLCVTVPFPGNLFSAFRCAQFLKEKHPSIKTAMGGGFPNTELRSIKDPRVFQFFDFITLDDGELPIELLHRHVCTPSDKPEFKRTFLIENGAVVSKTIAPRPIISRAKSALQIIVTLHSKTTFLS